MKACDNGILRRQQNKQAHTVRHSVVFVKKCCAMVVVFFVVKKFQEVVNLRQTPAEVMHNAFGGLFNALSNK